MKRKDGRPKRKRKSSQRDSKTRDWLNEVVAAPPQDECIVWPFAIDTTSGYGKLFYRGRYCTAHRVALVIATGENPEGMEAAHGPCHNRACCNPRHLSWKTVAENHADKVRDGTHNRGANHTSAKLTPEQVLSIVADQREHKVIATEHGVSRSVVSSIKVGGHWNWLTKIKETNRVRTRKSENGATQAQASDGSNGGS